jgi:hypothetical protein
MLPGAALQRAPKNAYKSNPCSPNDHDEPGWLGLSAAYFAILSVLFPFKIPSTCPAQDLRSLNNKQATDKETKSASSTNPQPELLHWLVDYSVEKGVASCLSSHELGWSKRRSDFFLNQRFSFYLLSQSSIGIFQFHFPFPPWSSPMISHWSFHLSSLFVLPPIHSCFSSLSAPNELCGTMRY